MMNGFERRTQQKREAIMAAAQEMFTTEGFVNVSVSDIAKRAGVSPVTIFKYFGDKMSLARETLMAYISESLTQYEAMLDLDMPFMEKMRITLGIKQHGIELLGRNFRNNRAWQDPVLNRMVKEISLMRAVPIYNKLIETGKREGAIDPTIPNEAIMDYFFMFLTLLDRSDFLNHGEDYMMGIVKLAFYGIIGKATL